MRWGPSATARKQQSNRNRGNWTGLLLSNEVSDRLTPLASENSVDIDQPAKPPPIGSNLSIRIRPCGRKPVNSRVVKDVE